MGTDRAGWSAVDAIAGAVSPDKSVEITGRFSFKDMNAILIRDPDRNVLELDAYPGDDPASRLAAPGDEIEAYDSHP